MLAVESVIAQESVASASQISTATQLATLADQAEDIIPRASSSSERRPASSVGSGERAKSQRDDGKGSRSIAPGFNLEYGKNQIAERVIDERIIDRLGLFDRPESGGSSRWSASLDLENEDSDWSFEVTFTFEF